MGQKSLICSNPETSAAPGDQYNFSCSDSSCGGTRSCDGAYPCEIAHCEAPSASVTQKMPCLRQVSAPCAEPFRECSTTIHARKCESPGLSKASGSMASRAPPTGSRLCDHSYGYGPHLPRRGESPQLEFCGAAGSSALSTLRDGGVYSNRSDTSDLQRQASILRRKHEVRALLEAAGSLDGW